MRKRMETIFTGFTREKTQRKFKATVDFENLPLP